MSTEKVVFNKLFKGKTKLSKHSIKLSLADDINEAINLIEPIMQDGINYSDKLRDLGKRIGDLANETETTISMASAFIGLGYNATEQVDEVLNKAEDAAAELGIDPNTIDGFTKLEEIANADYFRVKSVEDAYWEEVKPNTDDLKAIVDNF
jgi:hypothetical protein